MPTLESVVRCDPDVLGGTPVFAGTRVPIKNLLDYLAAGDSRDRFIDHFPSVTREQAVAAFCESSPTAPDHCGADGR